MLSLIYFMNEYNIYIGRVEQIQRKQCPNEDIILRLNDISISRDTVNIYRWFIFITVEI